MKTNNSVENGLNLFSDMIFTNTVGTYAVHDPRVAKFGKERFFKRSKVRSNHSFFSFR